MQILASDFNIPNVQNNIFSKNVMQPTTAIFYSSLKIEIWKIKIS